MRKHKPLQVIVLGHPLSKSTHEYLMQRGPYRVFEVFLHIPSFDQVFETVQAVYTELAALGVDLSGNTPTIFQASGSSAGALAMAAAWEGLTGQLPEVLNLIRVGNSLYAPSRELPTLDLEEFALKMRAECEQYGVRVLAKSDKEAGEEAVDDGTEVLGTLPLGSLKNQVRPLRRLAFHGRAQAIAELARPRLEEAGA